MKLQLRKITLLIFVLSGMCLTSFAQKIANLDMTEMMDGEKFEVKYFVINAMVVNPELLSKIVIEIKVNEGNLIHEVQALVSIEKGNVIVNIDKTPYPIYDNSISIDLFPPQDFLNGWDSIRVSSFDKQGLFVNSLELISPSSTNRN